MIEIRTMGDLAVLRNGEPLTLPASRKTRALCGYLALSDSKQSREKLCDLFWEIPDDPRGALRWSLSKLRAILNHDGQQVLLTHGDWVQFDRGHATVDLGIVQKSLDNPQTRREALCAYWENANQGLLRDCDITGQEGFADWLARERDKLVYVRAQVARKLAMDPASPDLEKVVWADRWLADMEFDSEAALAAVAARRQAGQHAQASHLAARLTSQFLDAHLAIPDFEPKTAADASSGGLRRHRRQYRCRGNPFASLRRRTARLLHGHPSARTKGSHSSRRPIG